MDSTRYDICLKDFSRNCFNPLNAKLNPICHLMALLGAHHILHISRVRVKEKGEWSVLNTDLKF